MGPSGGVLGLLGRVWSLLGASWGIAAAFWDVLVAPWGILAPSWPVLGRSWARLGRFWDRLGPARVAVHPKTCGTNQNSWICHPCLLFLKIFLFRGPVLVSPGHALAKARCGFRNLFDAHTACSRKLALQARWALRCAQGAGRGIRDEEAGNGTLWGKWARNGILRGVGGDGRRTGGEWNPAAGNGRGTGGERVRGAGTGEGQKAVWRSRIRF